MADLLIPAVTILLGLAAMLGLIRTARRKSYQHWSPFARWAFLGAFWAVGGFGAVLWITLWYERHPLAGLAQFAICAWVFWEQVMVPWRSASPATRRPPPTA